MRLVRVTWRDHSADKAAGWQELSSLGGKEEVIAQSVGWLVSKDDDRIVLAGAVSEQYGASIQIVLSAVVTEMVDLAVCPPCPPALPEASKLEWDVAFAIHWQIKDRKDRPLWDEAGKPVYLEQARAAIKALKLSETAAQ